MTRVHYHDLSQAVEGMLQAEGYTLEQRRELDALAEEAIADLRNFVKLTILKDNQIQHILKLLNHHTTCVARHVGSCTKDCPYMDMLAEDDNGDAHIGLPKGKLN